MERLRTDELVTLALKETSRAVLIGYGRTEVSDRARAVRSSDLDEAAANLQLALSRGFKDAARLRAAPDAPFLLARDELECRDRAPGILRAARIPTSQGLGRSLNLSKSRQREPETREPRGRRE